MYKAIDIFSKIINFIMPPRCGICDTLTIEPHYLCHNCFSKLHYIPEHSCVTCGYPFELDVGIDMKCGRCLEEAPYFDKAIAPFYYSGSIRDLILKFKHTDKTYLAPTIAYLMENYLRRCGKVNYDLILPVPLHTKKLFKRRYNQSALVGKIIAKRLKIPFLALSILRIKDNTQKGKNQKQRRKLLRNNFKCAKPSLIKNKKILLVDDVLTTGATVNEISRILKKHGASSVDVLTLARVSLEKKDRMIKF